MAEEEAKQEETAQEEAPAQEAPKEEEAAPAEAPAEEKQEEAAAPEGADVEVPEQFKKLVEQIEQMSVLELNELVKVLEKRFGVSAVAVAAPAAGGALADAEEKTEFTVELKDAGAQKIQVIKAVKEALGLGLKEAKDLVDGAPAVLKEGMKKEEAADLKAKVEEAGGSIELK